MVHTEGRYGCVVKLIIHKIVYIFELHMEISDVEKTLTLVRECGWFWCRQSAVRVGLCSARD